MTIKNIIALACVTLATTSVQAMEKAEHKAKAAAAKTMVAQRAGQQLQKLMVGKNALINQERDSLTKAEQQQIITQQILPLIPLYKTTKNILQVVGKKAKDQIAFEEAYKHEIMFVTLYELFMQLNIPALGRFVSNKKLNIHA